MDYCPNCLFKQIWYGAKYGMFCPEGDTDCTGHPILPSDFDEVYEAIVEAPRLRLENKKLEKKLALLESRLEKYEKGCETVGVCAY